MLNNIYKIIFIIPFISLSTTISCSNNKIVTKTSESIDKASNKNSEDDFKSNSVSFIPTKQLTDSGVLSLENYKLPDNVSIDNVKIIKVNLDGRDINIESISLAVDDNKNIIFFMSKTDFTNEFSGNSPSVEKSIHTSDTFEQQEQEVRTQILNKYKNEFKTESEEISTPSFLKATVRGESLSRQKIAMLKKDASKLAKENFFIDRNFYAVLEIDNKQFKIQDTSVNKSQTISKFTILADQIKDISDTIKENKYNNSLSIPLVAEKVAEKDNSLLSIIENESDINKIIEVEEIEQKMKLYFGPEIAKKGTELQDIKISIDLSDLKEIYKNNPNLKKDAIYDSKDDKSELLEDSLKKATEKEKDVFKRIEFFGKKPIDDKKLFNPNKKPRNIFNNFENRKNLSNFVVKPVNKQTPQQQKQTSGNNPQPKQTNQTRPQPPTGNNVPPRPIGNQAPLPRR
ncbi:MAG: hypothetical protein U0457_08765 [Candidatus Sericytochromatia bacterium]